MRVLHILCDLSGGGAERLVLDLCRFSSIEAEVATVHAGGSLTGAFEDAGIRVRCAQRVRGRAGVRAVARLAAWSAQADVVHTHLWAGDFWGRPAARLAGRRIITTEHNTRAESAIRQRIWTAMAPLSHRIVCVSQAASVVVQQAGVAAQRLDVIENGIDLTRFSPGDASAHSIVLAVGRLTRQKGFDVLLEAVRSAPVPTCIVGEGEDRAELERRSVGLPVSLPGWRADIRPVLAEAAVMVIPSRWEGFGLVAVEAMASGVPVIASRVDGLVEVVGDAGVLVPPGDPAALSSAIHSLLADNTRRKEIARRGLIRARRFSTSSSMSHRVPDSCTCA